jgi:hypothetical protein
MVGFVEIERAEIADQKGDIASVLSETKTLVSFACRMNRENVFRFCHSRLTDHELLFALRTLSTATSASIAELWLAAVGASGGPDHTVPNE